MAQCPSCQAKFARAPVCPACGAKQPWSVEKKVGLGLAVVVALLFGIALAPDRARSPASPVVVEPPLDVTAEELYAAYAANEVSADDKFKGKRILVYGPVSSIEKDIAGNIVVRLEAGRGIATVDAVLPDSQKPRASAMERGQRVAMLCVGAGRMLGSPVLGGCVVKD